MFKKKLKHFCCFSISKIRKCRYMILGIFLLCTTIINIHNSNYSFPSIISLLTNIAIIIGSFVIFITNTLKKPIKLPLNITGAAISVFFILLILQWVIVLNTLIVIFGFSFRDTMIIFQIIGFLLFIPKITTFVTKSIARHVNQDEYDPNESYDWIKELVIVYAILVILVGYVFQTDALQYFLYDNNLI